MGGEKKAGNNNNNDERRQGGSTEIKHEDQEEICKRFRYGLCTVWCS